MHPACIVSQVPQHTYAKALQAWGRQLTAAYLNTAGPALLAAASAVWFCLRERCKHTVCSSIELSTVSGAYPPTCSMQVYPLLLQNTY